MSITTKENSLILVTVNFRGKHMWDKGQRVQTVSTAGPETSSSIIEGPPREVEVGCGSLTAETQGKHLLLFLCFDSFYCWLCVFSSLLSLLLCLLFYYYYFYLSFLELKKKSHFIYIYFYLYFGFLLFCYFFGLLYSFWFFFVAFL